MGEDISNDILFENNFLSFAMMAPGPMVVVAVGRCTSTRRAHTISNMMVRHNSTAKHEWGTVPGTYTNVTFRGNVDRNSSPATSQITFQYNVKDTGTDCCGNRCVAEADFVDEGAFDFHLQSGSAAIDFVPSAGPTDRHRQEARPSGRPTTLARTRRSEGSAHTRSTAPIHSPRSTSAF